MAANNSSRAVRLEIAGPRYDAELRRLLRENPMDGQVKISLEREPSFFAGALGGERHRTIVGRRPESDSLVGTGSFAIRRAYVNGKKEWLPYLGCLRVDRNHRGALRFLHDGFEMCRSLIRENELPFCLTSIISDNEPALRLLASGRRGLPTYRPIDEFESIVVPTGGRWRSKDVDIERGSRELLPEIVRLINRRGKDHQFATAWSEEEILDDIKTPGLRPSDFLLARRNGEIVACLALWDQRSVKQTVVRGYAPALARVRLAINLLAPMLGVHKLPRVGEALAIAFLSHIAVENDEPEFLLPLVSAARRLGRDRDLSGLVIGLSHRNRMTSPLKRAYRHRLYGSTLFAVQWPDRESIDAVAGLDGRVTHPELAVL